MNVECLKNIALAVAQEQHLETVMKMIVEGINEEPDDEPNKSKRQDCERRSLGEVFEKNRLETLLTSNQVARRLTGMALLMSQMGCG
jgi:hypothetical protein